MSLNQSPSRQSSTMSEGGVTSPTGRMEVSAIQKPKLKDLVRVLSIIQDVTVRYNKLNVRALIASDLSLVAISDLRD